MSEAQFDIADITPAQVDFIENDQQEDEEQLPESTLPEDSENEQPQKEEQAATDSEAYKNLQSAYTKVSQDNSELRNRLDGLEARLAQQPAPTHQNSFDVPSQQAQVDTLDAVDKEFEELKPVNARIRKLEELVNRQAHTIANNERSATQNVEMNAQQIHEQKILSVHPDAFNVANSQDFTGWLGRQPSYMQTLIQNGSADDIISLLNTYKSSAKKVDAARRSSSPNNGSGTVNTTNATKRDFTGAEIAAMSDAEFIRLESEIQQAQMEGRVT